MVQMHFPCCRSSFAIRSFAQAGQQRGLDGQRRTEAGEEKSVEGLQHGKIDQLKTAKRVRDCMIFGFGKSTTGMVGVNLIAFC